MEVSLMQSPEGVGSVKNSKRRKKKRSKKQVFEKGEAETRAQMNDKLEAFDDVGVYGEMDILEANSTTKLLSKNTTVFADSTGSLSKGNASRRRKRRAKRKKKAKIKDEVQSPGLGKMDAGLRESQTEEIKVDIQSIIRAEVDEQKVENECIKQAKIEKVQSMEDYKIVTEVIENINEEDMPVKRKRNKKRKKKAKIKNEAESINPIKMDKGSTENVTEGIPNGKREGEDECIGQATVGEENKQNLVAELTEILAEKDVKVKRKRKKKKRRRKEKFYEAAEIVNLIEMEKRPTEERTEGESGIMKQATTIGVEVQSLDKHKVVTELTANLAEGDVAVKSKKKRKAEIEDGAGSMNQFEMDNRATRDLTEGIATGNRKRKRNIRVEVQIMDQPEMNIESMENLTEGNATGNLYQQSSTKTTIEDEGRDFYQNKVGTGAIENLGEKNVASSIKRRKHKKARIYEVQNMSEHESVPKFHLSGAEYLYSKTVPVTSVRRKLLVLDVNGLLADVMKPAPKHCRGDIHIYGRAIFRRPFSDDFLKFCFENFEVGIWSSRSREIIQKIVKYLLGDLQEKLLFCWDMSHCTQTGFKTLENYHKPLVCKELRKIWENDDPKSGWKKGDFDESNTLLVDDSPYKALLNPLNTAIFPTSYRYVDKNDTSLGLKGDIRVYLEELAKCENVQKHVEQHPFGGKAIDEQNLSWGFYSKVVDRMSMQQMLS